MVGTSEKTTRSLTAEQKIHLIQTQYQLQSTMAPALVEMPPMPKHHHVNPFSTAMRLRLRRACPPDGPGFGFGLRLVDRGLSPVLKITSLEPGCEAERSGLVRPDDIILRVNNIDVSRCTYDEAVQAIASTPVGVYASFVVRAPFGFTTRLVTTFNEDGTPTTIRVTEREHIEEIHTEIFNTKQQVNQQSPIALFNNGTGNQAPALIKHDQLLPVPRAASHLNVNGTSTENSNGNNKSPLSQISGLQNQQQLQRRGSISAQRPIKLRNVSSEAVTLDMLHHKTVHQNPCTDSVCLGSLMKQTKEHLQQQQQCPFKDAGNGENGFMPTSTGERTCEQILAEAVHFMGQYYASIKRLNTAQHKERLREITNEVEKRGTYELKQTELIFGSKLAWRNAPRCIGRIQWSKLQVFDARSCTTAAEMFEAICNHIKYATNKGVLRSSITIMPQRIAGREDFRLWNQQLIAFAGYEDESGGRVVGDPINVEFTKICQQLGWKGAGTRWDILPIVISTPGEDPHLFPLPEELILRVPLVHPKFEWFKELDLQWYALPAVSSMKFDVGGIEFPMVPFSGWYMSTEIAVRDLCDAHRYNVLSEVAEKMGLDTNSNASLWKDRVVVELNTAVLHSFQMSNVTIVDQYTAAESFMKHFENETRIRGGCPADWVWIVPPVSGSLTPVFHQEMVNYELKPCYAYQDPAWKSHVWKQNNSLLAHRNSIGGTPRKLRFKEIAKAVKFTSNLFGKALSKRIKATILYATETGRSEMFAKRLGQIFSHAFNVQVNCMDEYDTLHLEHETLILVVTSTFGNGDAPENGEAFARQMQAAKMTGEIPPEVDRDSVQLPVAYLKYPSLDQDQSSTETETHTIGGDSGIRTATISPAPTIDESTFADHVGPLSNVRFAVFALGSSAYPNFCAFGRYLDSVIGELGAERIMKVGTGDELCGQEQSFNDWAATCFRQACDTFCLSDDIDMGDVLKKATIKPFLWSKDNVLLDPAPVNNEVDELGRVEIALNHLSVNKKVLRYKLLDRDYLHEGSPTGYEENLRKTIRVVLETEIPDAETHQNESDNVAKPFYLPGDHLAVYPENDERVVQALIDRLGAEGLKPDERYNIKIRSQDFNGGNGGSESAIKNIFKSGSKDSGVPWSAHPRLPTDLSLREALRRYFDITTPPSQQFLMLAADFASDKTDAAELKGLANNSTEYERWKAMRHPNLPEVLAQFKSVSLPAEMLFTQLPLLQPRYYSISSSPLTHSAARIELTIAVVQYTTSTGAEHRGVCSNYLSDLPIGGSVFGIIRSAHNFRLPKERDTPIVMVGPGTGIAPFRSFWQHRAAMKELNPEAQYAPMSLYFGCRVPAMQLYKSEIEEMQKREVIQDYQVAYSRLNGSPKMYVQDEMHKASKKIFQDIWKEKGHLYVCGDVSMAEGVTRTLKTILVDNGIKDPEMAIYSLKESMRYHEDIFGITLRTAEVTTKKSNDAIKRTLSNTTA